MRKVVILVGLCVLFSGNAWAQKKPRILVFPVATENAALRGEAEAAGALVLSEAHKVPGVEVKSTRDVESMLDMEQKRQMLGCASASCGSDLAGALDAEQVIQGSLSQLDGGLLLTLVRLRTRDAAALQRLSERLPKGGAMEEKVRAATRLLMKDEVSPPISLELRVLAHRKGGQVEVLQGREKLRAGDELAFEFTVTPAAHVYLIQKTRASGNLTVLFPQPAITQRNPLPARTAVRIPSGADFFEVDNEDLGLENIYVVASAHEMPRLQDAVAQLAGQELQVMTRQLAEDAMLAVLQDGKGCRKGMGLEGKECSGTTRGLKLKAVDQAAATARLTTAPGDDALFYTFTFEHVAPAN
jgi:hypothetical protein